MAEVSFEVDGEKQLSRNLRVFARNMKNTQRFNKEAIDIVEQRSMEIFEKQGSNVKKAPVWKGLSDRTLKARRERTGYYKRPPSNPKILRWTGNLQNSRKKRATKQNGILEFTAPYSGFHQRGGGKLPKRVIIDLDNKTNAEIVRSLQKEINRQIGIFGLQA